MFDLKRIVCKQRKMKCHAWRDVLVAKLLDSHWADWRDERVGPNDVNVSLCKGPDPHNNGLVAIKVVDQYIWRQTRTVRQPIAYTVC